MQSTAPKFHPHPMIRGALACVVGLLVILLATGCSPDTDAAPATEAAATAASEPGPAPEVVRDTFTRRLLLTGELVAEDGINLATPNANIWPVPLRWIVEDGTLMKKGETVVEFDNSQVVGNLEGLDSRLIEARNALLSKRSQVANDVNQAFFAREQKKADFEKARIEADIPAGVTDEQGYQRRQLDMEKARLELAAAEGALKAARETGERDIEVERLAVEKAERAVERAEENIGKLTLKAPRDGIVLVQANPMESRLFQTGDSAFPGTSVAAFPDLDTMMVEALLYDVDDGKIEPGDRVDATLDSFPDWHLTGTVREVSPLADTVDRVSTRRTFKVRIDLESIDLDRMRPGMSVKVSVERRSEEPTLLVPRRALTIEGRQVYARLADGEQREINVGSCNAELCVLLDGLDEGTRLSFSGGVS